MALDETAEDRTVAICCGAYLEDILSQAIATKLPGADEKLLEKLFGDAGPIGPAKARIDMARGLDLIDDEDRLIIIMIARVRNRFAHNIAINSFEHREVVKLLDKVQLTGRNKTGYEATYPPTVTQTRRQRFFCLATWVGVRLSNYVNSVRGTGKIYNIKTGPEDQAHKLDVIHKP